MLMLVEHSITFSEFPDEIALCLNLSLCPNHCFGCSESYLAGNIGTELTKDMLDKLIADNPGVSLIGFMGGDNDHETVSLFTDYIQEKYNLKVGMYSGRDFIDLALANKLNYYKIGGWRMPQGDPSTWSKQSCGPITFPFSNQRFFKREGNNLVDITDVFRTNPINNLENSIIK